MASSGRRLRILHVFRAPLGGLFRHVLDVARGQIQRGHAVGIFCDSSTGGTRADEVLASLARDLELGVHRLPMRRLPHPRDLLALSRLAAVCRRVRPNVLHAHGSKGGLYARLVPAPDPETVRAYTPHGGSFNYKPGSLSHAAYMRAEAFLGGRTDVFLFESEYVKNRFESFVGKTDRLVRVVHNGIAAAEFEPIERVGDPFDLVYIGELRPAKGIETLIDAVKLIRQQGTRLTLLVVGSGPSEADLHARAQKAGIWDSTTFVPPQPIRTALSRGRIMVIPSKAESLPYVILEAAAAGQPLVSTNVGGIGEIFGPHASELIPADDPTRLAEAILAKVNEPEASRCGKAALLSAYVRERFCIERMVTGGLDGYRDARAAQGLVRI